MTGTGKRILLLPEKRRFAGQQPSTPFIRLGRRFRAEVLEPGETCQLQRYFRCSQETGWPLAALCRQRESGDAGSEFWLRADPVFLQVEMRGARVMALDGFSLTESEMHAMTAALQASFADHGIDRLNSSQDFFYLRIRDGIPLPSAAPVTDMLGYDIADYLPSDRRWMALFNESQIVLHNHPLNVTRQRNGQLPVNGLWFWGGGSMPASVEHDFETVISNDGMVHALAQQMSPGQGGDTLCDMRHSRSWPEIEAGFDPAIKTVFDFADGTRWHWQPEWRWHFWKRKSVPVF
jgi:hypothetical protein